MNITHHKEVLESIVKSIEKITEAEHLTDPECRKFAREILVSIETRDKAFARRVMSGV